jgi:hypothetical protein
MKAVIKSLFRKAGFEISRSAQYQQEEAVQEYLAASSIPWSPGYQ